MLNHQERQAIFQKTLNYARQKGINPVRDINGQRYEIPLRYCSVAIIELMMKHSVVLGTEIEIEEHFINGDLADDVLKSHYKGQFFGIRPLYRGSIYGLEEITLRAIDQGNRYGSLLSSGELSIGTRTLSEGRKLTNRDKNRFDYLLKYVQRELDKSAE